MFKLGKKFCTAALAMSLLSGVALASPNITHDSFTGETNYKFDMGVTTHEGDSADKYIIKVAKNNGEVYYKLMLTDYIRGYVGAINADTGKLKVYNSSTNDYEVMDLVPIETVSNGSGLYSFVYQLPKRAMMLAKQGRTWTLGSSVDHEFETKCVVRNNYGEKKTYYGRFNIKYDLNELF